MFRVLKHEIEAKERSVSVGVSSFERRGDKWTKNVYFACDLNSSLQRGNERKKACGFCNSNNTLHGDVPNIQIWAASNKFWNEMGYVLSVLRTGTLLTTVPWIVFAINAVVKY